MLSKNALYNKTGDKELVTINNDLMVKASKDIIKRFKCMLNVLDYLTAKKVSYTPAIHISS